MRTGSATRGSNLCLVMAVADADPAAVRRTLQSIRRQRGGWSLTVVTAENRLPEIRGLVHAAMALRNRRRVRVLGAGGPGANANCSGSGSRRAGASLEPCSSRATSGRPTLPPC